VQANGVRQDLHQLGLLLVSVHCITARQNIQFAEYNSTLSPFVKRIFGISKALKPAKISARRVLLLGDVNTSGHKLARINSPDG